MSGHVDGPFDAQKVMVDALRFYADERSWLGDRELRGFPGFHGRQIAANALRASESVVLVDVQEVKAWLAEHHGTAAVPAFLCRFAPEPAHGSTDA